jgi:uncharacterized protein (TIGR01244 family)
MAWLLPFGLAAGCPDLPDTPVPPPEMPALGEPVALPDDAHRLFDFWLGEWNVQNKHLRPGGTWEDSGTAVARIRPVVDGGAVLEQWNGTIDGDPLFGFSLRAHDPGLDQWIIYLNWHGGRPGGFSKMHGAASGERIEQFPPGDDSRLRYSFSLIRQDSCQWDQARSEDGEAWITDWVMQFTRRDAPLPLDATNAPIVAPPEAAGAFEAPRALDFMIGAWEGGARVVGPDGTWQEDSARARVTSMLEGFGLLQFLDTGRGEKSLVAIGHDTSAGGWVALRADNRSPGLLRMEGAAGGDRTVLFASSENPALRESWSCTQIDRCSFLRETSPDGGTSWQAVLEAELTRSISTAAWIDIPKARTPFPDVLTGGQPTEEQLARAARNGYRTVIDLLPLDEEGHLAEEGETVRELGMDYVLIPIAGGTDVTTENAARLAESLQGDDVLPAVVHCRSGNRVGALFALKAHELDGVPAEEALALGRRAGLTRLEPLVRERLGLPEGPEE